MTTPMKVFRDLAIRFGEIDDQDAESVYKFYNSDINNLSKKERLIILEELFNKIDEVVTFDEKGVEEGYEIEVDFPRSDEYQHINLIGLNEDSILYKFRKNNKLDDFGLIMILKRLAQFLNFSEDDIENKLEQYGKYHNITSNEETERSLIKLNNK